MIQSLFPIPVGIYERNIFSQEEFDFVKNSFYKKNVLNKVSKEKHFLNNPELKNIKAFIEQCLCSYVREAYQVTTKFEIILSWCNLTEPGEAHHLHYHKNSIFSGTYYFQDLDKSPLLFENYNEQRLSVDLHNKDGVLNWNEYNSKTWSMNHIKANSCLIFPSYLYHSVAPNTSDENRYSIAFNVFIAKGETIGTNATQFTR